VFLPRPTGRGTRSRDPLRTDPIAKSIFQPTNSPGTRRLIRNDPKSSGVTVDTPVPYRLEDLTRLIDERMGKLENRAAWARYHRLITRIETARNDPRYGFMFDNANVGGDTMSRRSACCSACRRTACR